MNSSSGSAVAPAARNMPLGAILITSTTFALAVIFGLVIYCIQYCINSSVRMLPSGGSVLAASRVRDKGVDPELLRSLPTKVYRAAAQKSSAAEDRDRVECAVCLSELQDGEVARFLPPCGHGFHARCVDKWLASHSTCPLCRVTVAKPGASLHALTTTGLPPVPQETANYAANLPASVLLGVSDQATLGAVTVTSHGSRPRPAALVIDIPDSRTVATPRDAAKTPGSARLRSLKRLWSFGRQGPSGSTPSYSWGRGSGSGTADADRGD
ncbi:hypothetical protein QYE76_023061 [Lolium multiflorum]|uniref:RING-type E3 ubiquitin transferase n=1 Tax=Lolium multiflorum TaxID=4521 RepID=A0AAD8RCL1_LOLMU|nr:hypothetical protein QYE76_023061 [Lolium multiflorum]